MEVAHITRLLLEYSQVSNSLSSLDYSVFLSIILLITAIADRTPPKGPLNGTNGSNGTKKRSASPIMNDSKGKEDEDDYYPSTASSSKRKAHAPSMTSLSKTTPSPQMNTSLSSRPVRQESASPPEDPTMGKEELRGKSSKMTSVSPHAPPLLSSSSLLPPSSSSSRAPSTSPRTDWNAVYGVITSPIEADNYINAFTTSYSEYTEMHSKLSKVRGKERGGEYGRLLIG